MASIRKIKAGLKICTSKEPCNGCPYLKERNCSLSMVKDALELLKNRKEVVHCKDCKHRSDETYTNSMNKKVYVCQINDVAKRPYWFCADGERRECNGKD